MAAATASVEKELAAAREPIPVKRSEDSVSRGLTSAVDRESTKQQQSLSRGGSSEGKDRFSLPVISLDGVQTWLKLRTRVRLSREGKDVFKPRLAADLGLDINPQRREIRPVAALSYQLRAKDVEWGTLRVTPQRAAIVRSFPVSLDRLHLPVRFTLNAAAGMTYQGRPDFDVNVGDLKPNWLVGVAAVTLLAFRQPLTGVKTFGDTAFTNPIKGLAVLEAKAKAQRQGNGLELGLGAFNAIIRV